MNKVENSLLLMIVMAGVAMVWESDYSDCVEYAGEYYCYGVHSVDEYLRHQGRLHMPVPPRLKLSAKIEQEIQRWEKELLEGEEL